MFVKRPQAGLAVLVATSMTLALLAAVYHSHGLAGEHTKTATLHADQKLSTTSIVCSACALAHAIPALSFDCGGLHAPGPASGLAGRPGVGVQQAGDAVAAQAQG